MNDYLVPCEILTWQGELKRKTYRVQAVSEREAQEAVSVPTEARSIRINHAVPVGEPVPKMEWHD